MPGEGAGLGQRLETLEMRKLVRSVEQRRRENAAMMILFGHRLKTQAFSFSYDFTLRDTVCPRKFREMLQNLSKIILLFWLSSPLLRWTLVPLLPLKTWRVVEQVTAAPFHTEPLSSWGCRAEGEEGWEWLGSRRSRIIVSTCSEKGCSKSQA